MMRAKRFMENYAHNVLDIGYYWGRVEFAPGRRSIHLCILGIAKNMGYLHDFHKAKGEKKKIEVLRKYAEGYLEMTIIITNITMGIPLQR